MMHQVRNYIPLGRIGTAGQPAAEQFAPIKAAGYQVVVNLALPDSPDALPNEAELVADQGMVYEHIPVIWESPTPRDLERFFAVMESHREANVFVHCVVNKRVSAFAFLYRVIRQGVPLADARKALLQIWKPNPIWHRFINDALTRAGLHEEWAR
jgi:protein tyrosine phosphatase (PTP) superfamily phosphohydrolase (DUF442 family)